MALAEDARRSKASAALVAVMAVGLIVPIVSRASATPVGTAFVEASGHRFVLDGATWELYGASTYGTSNPGGPTSIADLIDLATAAGVNTLRIVNPFDERGVDPAAPSDETSWRRVDELLDAMHDAGIRAILDLSGFRNHLRHRELYTKGLAAIDDGYPTPGECSGRAGDDLARCVGVRWCIENPTSCTGPYSVDQAAAWDAFLEMVATRVNTASGVAYRDDPTIALVAFAGEPDPPNSGEALKPTTQELTDFYGRVTSSWKALDANHLTTTGGLLHIDWEQLYGGPSGIDVEAIAALPGLDVLSVHTYFASFPATDANDHKVEAMAMAAEGTGKPWINEEFGFLQAPTDGVTTYTEADRGDWFQNVFEMSREPSQGVPAAGVAFWNLGFEVAAGSHDVNPDTPATWAVVRRNSPELTTYLTPQERYAWCPMYSPDGSTIAYAREELDGLRRLVIMRADGSDAVTIPDSIGYQCDASFSPDGTRVAFTGTRDPSQGTGAISVAEVDGSSTTYLDIAERTGGFNIRHPSWSPLADSIVFEALIPPSQTSNIYRMDPDGTNIEQLTSNGVGQPTMWPTFSPDGSQIAYESYATCSYRVQIWVMDHDGSDQRALTPCGLDPSPFPVWSPQGDMLAFGASDYSLSNQQQVYVVDVATARQRRLTSFPSSSSAPDAWSPDGSTVYLSRFQPDGDIFAAAADGTRLRQLTSGPALDYVGDASSDGTSLLIMSDRSCRFGIWTIPSEGTADPTVCTDSIPPTIEVASPLDDASYPVGADLRVRFTCADDPDGGVHGCGTEEEYRDGDRIYTGRIGTYTLTFYAYDFKANRTELTVSYHVVASTDADGDGIDDTVDPEPDDPSFGFDDGAGTSGAIVDSAGLQVSVEDADDPADGVRVVIGPGAGKATLSVCGMTVKLSAGSDATFTCGSVIVDVTVGVAEIELGGGLTIVTVPAGGSGLVSENADGTFSVQNLGTVAIAIVVDGQGGSVAPGSSLDVTAWDFQGFGDPIDMPEVLNVVKAGQVVPLSWRLVDATGQPITTLGSVSVRATTLSCVEGSSNDWLEETGAGSSGLQNLGDGYYRYNWRTPKSYAKSCKTLLVDLGEGVERRVLFRFTK